MTGAAVRVLTVGHSTLALDAFVALVSGHGVTRVADVRAWPRSRRHPQFDSAALSAGLAAAGIGYSHLPELGGMRRPSPDSPHTALPDGAFRGYADHMSSAEFERGVRMLLELAERERVAVMCAEARPEHCHRSLLADALLARGVSVEHIVGPEPGLAHRLNPLAHRTVGRLVYAGPQASLDL